MGAEPQSRNLGKPLLYDDETGNPNQYVHIWAYENAGDAKPNAKTVGRPTGSPMFRKAASSAPWKQETA